MEQIGIVNARLLARDLRRPLAELLSDMVDTHAAYFEHPIPRIVYLQYFLSPTPELFALFDEKFDRAIINQFADLCQHRNPNLARDRSELIGEVFHRTYNSLLLVALKAEGEHRHKLYAELKKLLYSYLAPDIGDDLVLPNQVMICPECRSQKIVKNGHRHGKQRFVCKACCKQFASEYGVRGYPPEIRQKCLAMHQQGISFREIERQTGVNHNTVINWAKESIED
jgi:transposase-like protein